MAKHRMINTKFWSDPWVMTKLNSLDRLLFLYLITNEHANISGIYEVSIHTVAFETGIEKDTLVKAMMPRLAPKIYYEDSWVIIPNFPKHQNIGNNKIMAGIKAELANVPQKVYKKAIGYGYPIHDSSMTHDVFNPNSNSNSKIAAPAAPFSLNTQIEKMEANSRRDLNIIAFYFRERKSKFNDMAQLQVGIRRHLRAAKQLIPFTDDQISKAARKAATDYPEWTLETVTKILTK